MRIDKCQSGSLGYECNHQQNLKTMRGAKSNALFFRRANRSPNRPCGALVVRPTFWTTFSPSAGSGVNFCISHLLLPP
jgi:hypothetical protein